MNRYNQQARIVPRHPSHSLSWREKDRYNQQARIVPRHHSHSLSWRAKNRHQQAKIAARHHNYSHPENSRTDIISRLEL
jgi:hypothetical protein